jgi:23S rRNA pseudouridine1911/1915/1917 synthase
MENQEKMVLYLSLKVSENDVKKRLDLFLKEKYPEYSRSYFQKLAISGDIFVNSVISDVGHKLKLGDLVEVMLSKQTASSKIEPENIALDIIYEDEDLIAVNKPAQMVVHPACGNFSGTLVNALSWHFNNLPFAKDARDEMSWTRPGLVHRLDKETSGIILIAKNDDSLYKLAKQFESRKIKKTYLAICLANNDVNEGKINIAIIRDHHDRKKMSVATINEENAKQAVTYFKVKQKLTDGLVLIEAKPETGRTHQIRVHLSQIGYPILGDTVYGIQLKRLKEDVTRTMLHAYQIEFEHPRTKEKMILKAEIPADFNKILTLK